MPEPDISVTFPISDTISLATGDTVLDFLSGKATLPDSSTRSIGNKISRDRPLKSVYLEINQDINIEMRLGDDIQYKGRVAAGSTELVNITFDQIVITTTTATTTFLTASTAASILTAMRTNIDVQLGAVELKNATTDDRALISDANTARAATDHVLEVQQLDASGKVPPSGDVVGNAPFTKITDGTDTALVTAGGSQNVLDDNSSAIKTAVEIIDNFISGARGLVTEDNSAAIKTAVEARVATTPTVYNVTMTTANTEYSQALPANTKILEFRCQSTGYATRFAFETGKVAAPTAPYRSLDAGEVKTLDGLNLTSKTLYFACSTAAQVMEIECWT